MKNSFKFFGIIILALLTLGIFVNNQYKKDNLKETVVKTDLLQSGKLVIVGGAMRDSAIINTFIEAAGGTDANYVVIPSAMADTITGAMMDRSKEFLQKRGISNIKVLHTKIKDIANSDEFIEPILAADGIWFTGGRQWRIVDSYFGTATQIAFESVLKRGGVIGGSSAGATIQGSYLARGDTKTNTIMMGDHEKGFGYLPNSAIDQHLLRRNRQFDLVEIVRARPELLGIGIDENTAILVEGEEFKVIGNGYVAIYDQYLWEQDVLSNAGKFFLLADGDIYNWKKRKVLDWSGNGREIQAITLQED